MYRKNVWLAGWNNSRENQARLKFSRVTMAKCSVFVGILVTVTMMIKIISLSSLREGIKPSRIVDKQLIDLRNFEITSDNSLCQKKRRDGDLKLLQIGIHSSRENYNRRHAIRNTWGSLKTYDGWQISTAFILGSPPNPSNSADKIVTAVVNNETKTYNDIVIGSFTDSYRNLTYKHMTGYKWILDSCPDVDVYVKTDDDVFVNVFKLVDWLKSHVIQDYFYCYVLHGYRPWRSKRYKFYISKDEYKPEKFPDYCSGMGYITKPSLMSKLLDVSKRMKYLWVEDLFSTGLLVKCYNEEVAQLQSETDSFYGDNPVTQHAAKVTQIDLSDLYLNERYNVYKQWIDDNTQKFNNWLFILLENKNEQTISWEQRLLWQKTVSHYPT